MDEKLKILLCEDDENLGMLLREYLAAKAIQLNSALMVRLATRLSSKPSSISVCLM